MTILTTAQTTLVSQVKKDLEKDEGFREFAYPDPKSKLHAQFPGLRNLWGFKPVKELLAGKTGYKLADGMPWTVGFGNTHGVTPDSRLDRIRAERLLEEHILEVDNDLRNTLSWYNDASFVTKTVLINMTFNMGLAGVLKFRNTLAYIGQKNYKQAAANMRKSLWYQQVTKRAERLAVRMESQSL